MLSVCMIVKDEADNLPACLKSLNDLAAEVWVFDTGSTDETVAIATALGATVQSLPWPHDFAAARNASLQAAQGDWILVIDADETLTEAGRTCVQAILAQEALAGIPVSELLLVTWLRQEIGLRQSPYTQVSRLFRRLPTLKFQRPYHETIDESVEALIAQESHWQIAQLSTVAMIHRGYTADAIATRQKVQRARTLIEPYLADHPEDAYLCNKLGAMYGQQGDWQKGLPWLQQGLAAPHSQRDPLTQYELYYHLALAHRHLGQGETALTYYQQAVAMPIPAPLKISAYLNLGSLLKHQGQLLEAINVFTTVVDIDPTQAIAHYNLGVTHSANGSLATAMQAYRAALALDPDYGEAYQNLGTLYFKLGRLPESRIAFEAALKIYQRTNPSLAQQLKQGYEKLGFHQW